MLDLIGAPERIRTSDRLIRSQVGDALKRSNTAKFGEYLWERLPSFARFYAGSFQLFPTKTRLNLFEPVVPTCLLRGNVTQSHGDAYFGGEILPVTDPELNASPRPAEVS